MKKMGIRRTGLLVHSALAREYIYKLSKKLSKKMWMITGCIANQIWIYVLAGNCVFCRPTDNLDIIGVNIMRDVEELFGVVAEGFYGDLVRRMSILISHEPKFKINVTSYNNADLIEEINRRKCVEIWRSRIPIISMEDQIIAKLTIGRREDIIDIIGLLRAYKKYLRASILYETDPRYLLSFSELQRIIHNTYPEMEEDMINELERISGSSFDSLLKYEKSPRRLIELLNV